MSDDRQRLQALLTALDATPRALRRDPCGTFAIMGKAGHIFADGLGYLLCVCTGELVRRWTGVKSRLRFCRVTQDGDDEGCLHLDRLPTRTEASAIRKRSASDSGRTSPRRPLLVSGADLFVQKNDLWRPSID